jgi:serine O-acetyltransferase
MDERFSAPVLGRQVNVGAGAKILGHVRIGDGAQIGANAVVLCDVPNGALAVGVPAKIIRNTEASIGGGSAQVKQAGDLDAINVVTRG